MQLSKLNQPQQYTTLFELQHKKFERNTQRHQIKNTFTFNTEEVFKTLETSDFETTTPSYSKTIESIVDINFGDNFHNKNIPKQRQHVYKHTPKYQRTSHPQYPNKNVFDVDLKTRK